MNSVITEMNNFKNSTNSIESRFETIYKTAQEMLTELEEAKASLTEASASLQPVELEEVNKFKKTVSESIYKECDTLKDTFAKLNDITNEYKEFSLLESETRLMLQQNIMAFDEKQLKKLSAPRSGNTQYQRHSKYAALEELIENAKNGVTNDLVMDDQPQHQVSKCPITQKPINKPFKNECGHVYEHEAIVQFTKGKSGIKRCPVSGCPSNVVFKK